MSPDTEVAMVSQGTSLFSSPEHQESQAVCTTQSIMSRVCWSPSSLETVGKRDYIKQVSELISSLSLLLSCRPSAGKTIFFIFLFVFPCDETSRFCLLDYLAHCRARDYFIKWLHTTGNQWLVLLAINELFALKKAVPGSGKKGRKESSALLNTLLFSLLFWADSSFPRLSPGALQLRQFSSCSFRNCQDPAPFPHFITAHFHDSGAGWEPHLFSIWQFQVGRGSRAGFAFVLTGLSDSIKKAKNSLTGLRLALD